MYMEKLESLQELKRRGLQIEPNGVLIDNFLKDFLSKYNLNVIDLAERTGISRQTLHNIMRGTYSPGIEMVLKIAAVLRVSVEELFQLKEEAWFSRVKKAGERTLYVDVINLIILDKEAMDQEVQEDGNEYYDMKTNRIIKEEEKKAFIHSEFERILNEPEELYTLLGEKESLDKRSIPRLLKEQLEELYKDRFIPKYQKLVKVITR